MPKQRLKFTAPVDQVAANDIHNHTHCAHTQPPDDADLSLECPQCHRLTWRYSERCMHCGLNTAPLSPVRWWVYLLRRWRLRRGPAKRVKPSEWGLL